MRWTGELAGAMGARARLAAGDDLAHHFGLQRARAVFRKVIGLRPARLVVNDLDHLRDDVAGALDRHRVADPHAQPLDLVLIVQGGVLHHHTADRDGFELRNGRQRAGAADLNFDVAHHGRGALGGELVRNRPARRARHEAETLLPIQPVGFIDHTVDVVFELGALQLDVVMEGQELLGRLAELPDRIDMETGAAQPLDHGRLLFRRHFTHLAPGIGEETQRA
jgi:hypothetical protein